MADSGAVLADTAQPTPQEASGKEKSKSSKQYKLSARMALLSKGGQKNKPVTLKDSSEGKDQRSTSEPDKGQRSTSEPDKGQTSTGGRGKGQMSTSDSIESPDIVTSDYDSCFETDVECVGGGEGVRRVETCECDDADSGVVESATGAVAVGTDLGVSCVFL